MRLIRLLQFTHKAGGATMRSPWGALAFGVVAALGVVLGADVGTLSAQASNPRIGTWKLNVEKSKFSPGPPPQSSTLKIETVGRGEKVTSEGVNAQGGATATQYTANFDGKDYPLTGSQNADTVSLKRIDARTTELTAKKDGTVTVILTRVVSEDGKTMTVRVKGTNAQGQPVDTVAVWEKQ
jgi:hypothetical protein